MPRWLVVLMLLVKHVAALPLSADSLRGYNGPDRAPFDAHFYQLNLRIDSASKAISGNVAMHFRMVSQADSLRLDLAEPLLVDQVTSSTPARFVRQGRFILLYFHNTLQKGQNLVVNVQYHGKPVVARRPPWQGGLVWSTDSLGRPFWGVACQGEGASLWWPCKDLPLDEPDSVDLQFTIPQGLQLVSNGRKVSEKPAEPGWITFHYQVRTPINLYNITYYAGHLVEHQLAYPPNPSDTLRFFALDYHPWGAQRLLKEAAIMLQRYEKLFGPYHAWKDGYKLVESPYWGMEHQSAIAYGNQFVHNAFGFDFILVHESGHEWFGNAITAFDRAHDWIQESFTTYGETLLLELEQGEQAILPYLESQRKRLELKQPMIGPEAVYYHQHDVDIYFKGAWMLHTLRLWWDDWAPGVTTAPEPGKFKAWLKMIVERFRHQPVSTNDLLQLANAVSGKKNEIVWDYYLTQTALPVLEIQWKPGDVETEMKYRWKEGLKLPLTIRLSQKHRISPGPEWKTIYLPNQETQKPSIRKALRHWLLQVDWIEE